MPDRQLKSGESPCASANSSRLVCLSSQSAVFFENTKVTELAFAGTDRSSLSAGNGALRKRFAGTARVAAIHNATMMAARRLNHVDNVEQQDSASNMLNKLARTFAIQVETLKKYRSTGEQNILVQHQHVTVNEGGQAIVGNVTPGGGATNKKDHQPHEPSGTDEPSTPMLGNEQTLGQALPSAGIERLERVPMPRSKRRGTDGET